MENQKTETWIEKAKPFIAVLFLQLGYAVMDVLSKAALNKGMSNYVFVVYRHTVAFIVIIPFALYFEKYNSFSLFVFRIKKKIYFHLLIITSNG